jgi:hypothetical protein
MSALANLRKRHDHQKLMGWCARLWSWMSIPIFSTIILFLGFAFADKLEARVLRGIFMGLGFLAVVVTVLLFVCLSSVSALDAVLHTRSRGVGRVWSVGLSSAPLLAAMFVVGYAVYTVIRAAMSR